MNRRTVAYLAALSFGACVPGLAFAQYYPPGAQIYRDPPAPGYRGLPPSWLVDDEDAAQAPPRAAPTAAYPQAPLASAAPDVPRPPANIDPNSQPPTTTAAQPPVTTASLPPASALPPVASIGSEIITTRFSISGQLI